MYKIGLKLWSENEMYFEEIIRLKNSNRFDYIELYAIPNTFFKHSDFWSKIGVPFVIHAPHFGHGVNLSIPEEESRNKKFINEARLFADKLDAKMIIVHPGVDGTPEETVRQLLTYNDTRLVVENKPHFGFTKDQICIGSKISDMKYILEATGLNFCLDFGHAIYAANGLNINPIKHIAEFLKFKPRIFHFTDGDWNALHDVHTRYGKGTFPLKELLLMIPDGSMLTNEAEKSSKTELKDFECDSLFIKQLSCQTTVLEPSFITVQLATIENACDIYNLSMDPDVRASSFNSEQFSFESHMQWLKSILNDEFHYLYICKIADEFAGQIRFRIQQEKAVVSISITKQWRGTGMAQRFFQLSVNALRTSAPMVKQIIAMVKKSNDPSNRFFQKVGFKRANEQQMESPMSTIQYIFELQ